MSRIVNRIIMEMVQDDVKLVQKMRKAELIELVRGLQEDLYRELPDGVLVETYEERYNTQLKGWL